MGRITRSIHSNISKTVRCGDCVTHTVRSVVVEGKKERVREIEVYGVKSFFNRQQNWFISAFGLGDYEL